MDTPTLMTVRPRLMVQGASLGGAALLAAVQGGFRWLQANREIVNRLNVFPVPDGDTGINMALTMQAAVQEADKVRRGPVGEVAHALAHGALMGARGNSGVILSQLWRGFAEALEGCARATPCDLVRALKAAREAGYKSVSRPVEGTILTVASDVAIEGERSVEEGPASLVEVLERLVTAARESVERTPQMLPVLKQAGVTDSGGMGLFFLLEGALRAARGLPVDDGPAADGEGAPASRQRAVEAIEPGQDWELVMDFRPDSGFDLPRLLKGLEQVGTSLQTGQIDGFYRIHIHIAEGRVYEPIDVVRGMALVLRVSMENLRAQVGPEPSTATPAAQEAGADLDQIGAVAVAAGPGFTAILKRLGAAVVPGGPSMNPSAQEILAVLEALPAEKAILLPNDKNVRLAAQQAAEMSTKMVAVIPSTSVPQGITAMLQLDPHGDFENVVTAMEAALGTVRTGELTHATRSVCLNGIDVREGQAIGLMDQQLVVAADSLRDGLVALLRAIEAGRYELLTMYAGADLRVEEVEPLAEDIRRLWPNLDLETLSGGQPHYPLVFSLE